MIKLKSLLENNEPDTNTHKIKKLYDKLGYSFDFKEFLLGMQVELEHRDITGGDAVMTAKIAAAHLREVPNYYTLLKKYVEK